MARKFSFKILIIIMTVFAFCLSAFAFTSSYAKWIHSGGGLLSSQITIGKTFTHDIENMEADVAVDIIKDKLDEQNINYNGGNSEFGGIISADGTVKAATWNNRSPVNKPHGYTVEVELEENESFIICVFSRICDPSNYGKAQSDHGYAVVKGDTNNLTYRANGEGVGDNTDNIFTAKEKGIYTFEVYEGTKEWVYRNRPSYGYADNIDVITVSYRTA